MSCFPPGIHGSPGPSVPLNQSSPTQNDSSENKDILIERLNDMIKSLDNISDLPAYELSELHRFVGRMEPMIREAERPITSPQRGRRAGNHTDPSSASASSLRETRFHRTPISRTSPHHPRSLTGNRNSGTRGSIFGDVFSGSRMPAQDENNMPGIGTGLGTVAGISTGMMNQQAMMGLNNGNQSQADPSRVKVLGYAHAASERDPQEAKANAAFDLQVYSHWEQRIFRARRARDAAKITRLRAEINRLQAIITNFGNATTQMNQDMQRLKDEFYRSMIEAGRINRHLEATGGGAFPNNFELIPGETFGAPFEGPLFN